MELSLEEKKILLKIAREAIRSAFTGKYEPVVAEPSKYPALQTRSGAFVTLTKREELRGCIGYIIGHDPVYETVFDAAKSAAFNDPRFPMLTEEELDNIDIEISVLSEPFKMEKYEDIELGKHGLILEEGPYRGLLLPQVPVEHRMTRDEFLSALCRKAGLAKDKWREKPLNIKMFTANVFSEGELE